MNVVGVSTKSIPIVKDEVPKISPHKSVYLYDEAPHTEMSLDMFEEYALKRLKVRAVDFSYSLLSLLAKISSVTYLWIIHTRNIDYGRRSSENSNVSTANALCLEKLLRKRP